MADSQYNIKIVVTDNGGTKLAEKNISSLGAAVERTGKQHSTAKKGADDFYNTLDKGVLGVSNGTKSFSKMAEAIGRGQSSGLVGAYATLAANLFAVTAAFNALRGASQVEQIFRGLEASGNRVGRTLIVAAQGLVEVTNNAISMEQALRSTAQISSAGFGADTIKALGQAARDTSFALGRNMTDSLDRLTRGVVKLEPELLDELGIMTKINESNALYANKLGKSESALTNFEKRQGFLNAVLAEAQLKFGGLSEAAGNSTNYDKLMATLTNLSNTILGVINAVAQPLAGLLSGSMATIAGVGILFASTLKNQLAPGLLNAAAAATKMAEKLQDAAHAELQNVTAAKDAAKAQAEAALNARRNYDYLGSKAPKVYKGLADSIREGTASIKEQDQGLLSLRRSYDANARLLRDHQSYNVPGDKQDAKLQDQANIVAEYRAVRQLQRETLKAQGDQVKNTEAVEAAEKKAALAAQVAQVQSTKAATLNAAANFEFGKALSGIIQATQEYSVGLKISGEVGVSAFGKLKVAAFAASLGVRAVGVALLNAIPIIGQIIFIAGLLKEAWDWSKSDNQKAAEEAMSKWGEIVAAVGDKVAAFQRANESQAPVGLRVAQSITIQANAVKELGEAYDAAQAARAKYNKTNPEDNVSSFGKAFLSNSDEDFTSYTTGLAKSSKLVQQNAKDIQGTARWFSFDTDLNASVTQLGKLQEIAPEATKRIVDMYGGFDKIAKLAPEQRMAQYNRIIKEVENSVAGAASQIEDLTQALKSTDQALGDFLTSAITTTSYDKVVTGLNSVTAAIENLQNSSAKGQVQTSNDWTKVLDTLGPNMMKFLPAATQELLKQRELADSTVQRLSAQLEMTGRLNAADQGLLDGSKRRVATIDAQNSGLIEQIEKMNATFELAQHKERVAKSEQTLLQAQIQALSGIYNATAKGVGLRIDAENKLKDLQASQLRAQKAIFDAALAESRAQMAKLKLLDAQNVAVQKLTDSQVRLNLETERANVSSYREQFSKRFGQNIDQAARLGDINVERAFGKDAVGMLDSYRKSLQEVDTLNTTIDRRAQENALGKAMRAQEDAAKALQDQIDAILMSETTLAQKQAAIAQKDAEIQARRLDIMTAQRSKLEDINDSYRAADALLNGTNDTLKEQVRLIDNAAARQRNAAVESANANIAKLKANLQLAQADAARATTGDERAAGAEMVKYAQEELDLAQQDYNVTLQQIDAQTRQAILEKVIFDTRKEGLDWQQQSLQMLQKQTDAARELSGQLQTRYELEQKLAAKRRGVEISQQGQDAIDIRAASETYKLAVQEVEIKKGLIDLEYALLDAQREQLKEDLATRKANLDATDPRNATRIAQIDSIISRLSSVNLVQAADMAKKTLDVQIENAKLTLQTAMTRSVKDLPLNDIINTAATFIERRRQRKAAEEALKTARPISAGGIVGPESAGVREANARENPLIVSNRDLIKTIEDWMNVIKSAMKMDITSSPELNPVRGINAKANPKAKQALAYLLSQGFTLEQAAGIVGNIQQESGFSTTIRDYKTGTHVGLAQWDPARQADFKKQFGKDLATASFEEQMKFIVWELKNTESKAGNMLKSATSAADAAKIIAEFYERAGKQEMNTSGRIKNANSYLDYAPTAANDNPKSQSPKDFLRSTNKPTSTPRIMTTAIMDVQEAAITTLPQVKDLLAQMPEVVASTDKTKISIGDAIDMFSTLTNKTVESLKALGPEGEAVAAVTTGMTLVLNTILRVQDTMKTTAEALKKGDITGAEAFSDRFTAIASVASAALSTIQSATAATAQAKEDAIQREIDAEQKRDGKSAESVAKIQALEKKKDEIARKQFNANKKIMMAQAVIATAAGIAQALTLGPIVGPIMAAVIGAMGLAQIAIIAGTSYQSTATTASAVATPSQLTIGKRGDTIDLAKQNTNVGGELGYLRGRQGTGTNSSNYAVVGSAYGGELGRGYGSTAYVVGEKGPETLHMDAPITVRPANDNSGGSPINATMHIHAIDASGVEEVLNKQKGNIISMLRDAANTNGQTFMEDVNVNVYSRPNATGTSRL